MAIASKIQADKDVKHVNGRISFARAKFSLL